MNFNLLKPVYQEGAGGDGGTGGAGGTEGPTLEELQAQLETLATSNAALTAKNVELLGETKAAKEARRAAEETARTEAENKAKADGDHEQLYKSSEEARVTLQTKYDGLQTSIANEKRDNTAMQIATTLADGDNVGLLSEHIAKRLKYTDEGIRVTDSSGALTISSLDDLATEFKNNTRYNALLKGNQSSGGGAAGGSNSGGAAKTMTRGDFDALNPIASAKFIKDGGSVID